MVSTPPLARPELTVIDVSACCSTGLAKPIPRPQAEALAKVLKAAADPTRLQLLSIIQSSGETCACDLNEPVGLSQPTVSHHLKVLTEAGLLVREQRGTWAWFTINPERVRDLSALFAPPARQGPQTHPAETAAQAQLAP